MAVTLAQMNTAIETTLATAAGLTFSQDFNELTEGMQDTPTLQVYWAGHRVDPTSQAAQRSFGAAVREKSFTFHADLYAQQRAHIGEDMAALLPVADAIETVLETQQTRPYFGLAEIKAIEDWEARLIIFEYGDPALKYIGSRFIIRVRVH